MNYPISGTIAIVLALFALAYAFVEAWLEKGPK